MQAHELEPEELQVFADLVTQMVLADGIVSDDELQELDELTAEFGEGFGAALATARDKSRDEALAGVHRVIQQSARDFILTVLHDMAHTDGVDEAEQELLETVRSAWAFTAW